MKHFLQVILILMALPCAYMVDAQNENITAKEGAKIQAKKEKESQDKAAGEYKKRQDQHRDIQDKKTRKRMKKNLKRSQTHSTWHKQPFYKRWFGKKRKL